jgi:hypothetical protein
VATQLARFCKWTVPAMVPVSRQNRASRANSRGTLSVREIGTYRMQLFFPNLQRFFKPSPSEFGPKVG